MKALLVIDVQNDFLPGGNLAVESGHEIIPVANRLMPQYEIVIATQDWHPADHGSFAKRHAGREVGDVVEHHGLDQVLWPEHCVQGTHGADFPKGLNRDHFDHVIYKGTDPTVDSYSAFFDNARRKATDLELYLRNKHVDEVHIIGLATDYCVMATALDAVDLGFRVTVLTDGIRGVNLQPGDTQRALDAMRAAGVEIR